MAGCSGHFCMYEIICDLNRIYRDNIKKRVELSEEIQEYMTNISNINIYRISN